MRIIMLALTLLASSHVCAFDLLGVEIGQRTDSTTLSNKFDVTCKSPDWCYWAGGGQLLRGTNGVAVNVASDWTLVEMTIMFKPSSFEAYAAALREKFGEPNSVELIKMQTVGGALLNDELDTWTNSRGDRLQLVHYITAAEGLLSIKTAQRVATESARGHL